MRYVNHIWTLIAGVLLLSACQSEEIINDESAEATSLEGTMPVHLTFNIPEAELVTTRGSMVSGQEVAISDIKMLCFNNTGNFLGLYEATVNPTTATTGTIDGEVDANTCSVHFIANHPNLVVSQSANYLREMIDVIKDKALSISYNDVDHITYWTYHEEATAALMAAFLNPQQSGVEQTIHFVRDRVKFQAMPLTQEVLDDSGIQSVEWMVTNGLSKGYVIPWRTFENPTTSFVGLDLNEAFFDADNIKITPYEKLDRSRYNPAANDESLFEPFTEGSSLFTFEDYNNGTYNGTNSEEMARVKLIFKVTFTNNPSQPKYHVIKVMDEEMAPFLLKRNHCFRVNILNLRETRSALSSFEEALNTDQFSNDQFANVADVIPSVSEQVSTLTIIGGTTKELNSGNTTLGADGKSRYTFEFEYTGRTAQLSDFQFSGLEASFGQVVNTTYNSSTGRGTVTVELAKPIPALGQTPLSGRLRVFEKNSKLYRFVLFYAVEGFTYPQNKTPTMTYSQDVTISGTSTRIYDLAFTIPAAYPEGLYPITVVIGSRTLTPWSDVSATTQSGSFEVAVESTGASGWNYPANTSTANADLWKLNGNTWNYVYKYKIDQKPLNEDGTDYSTVDQTYHIYLRDNRTAINAANTANVGLYFQVQNFGSNSQYQIYGLDNPLTSSAVNP